MTITLKAFLEKTLIETWGITFNDLKGKDNQYSYERGCLAYYMMRKNVPVAEIAEIFEISVATIYQYRDRVEKEKQRINKVSKYFIAIYGT